MSDPSLIITTEYIVIKDNLSYEEIPADILDRQVRKLRTKEVASDKVLWGNQFDEEDTWESKEDMKNRNPHLFEPEEILDQGFTHEGCLRVGKKGKLSPMYIGPERISKRIEYIVIKDNLSSEEIPAHILDRQVRKLRTKEVASVKVLWGNQFVEEDTWESKDDMKNRNPHLFEPEEILDQDVFTDHTGLQYVFSQKELNLKHRRQRELLKEYDISILYHPGKTNVVADVVSRLSMCSTAHVEEEKRELTKDVHRLARLGVQLMDSNEGGIVVMNGTK
ncbi:hypothetical protein MTR67_001888 [Solanum verrucosum]|uniref:Uncharacterized protein n=1 Tax=Solanum verrucosum TaxID=315347 RepID=A0AAF0PNZ1_SOLVR|nr:hypothetical protein MTR67_001888 [Solanum verrucosum]